jgi:mRNA interferase MazF
LAAPEPLRGEVWDVNFPGFGLHPSVVMSVNTANSHLGHVAVIPITGTPGPDGTHVALAREAGLTRYSESYADVTALQPVARSRFRRRRGLTHRAELEQVEQRLRVYLGL